MADDNLPIPNWQKALLNCAVLATIAAISTLQATPDASLKAACLAFLITFLVQFKALLHKGNPSIAIMGVI